MRPEDVPERLRDQRLIVLEEETAPTGNGSD